MPSAEQIESDSVIASRVTVEIRLRAVTEVLGGAPVAEVAERFGVSRQTITMWCKRYQDAGMEGSPTGPDAHIRVRTGSSRISRR
ncbi:helix-turn-helix domain-containing protein [Rhodococcus rhodochrous]|uniref:helix-turn-helix domain-containing protein n=1 Tax=Rhodococcus rhodochrous TaxID=1829 RepID=UPI0021BD500D|nr:helix-turn-helix domain-containing protein [Rhodococcus rhodochrous]